MKLQMLTEDEGKEGKKDLHIEVRMAIRSDEKVIQFLFRFRLTQVSSNEELFRSKS